MAVDRPGDYYNPPTNYEDLDGNLRTFTYRDFDKRPIPMGGKITEEEAKEAKEGIKNYRTELQERILSLPASLCPFDYQDFTVRGEGKDTITWNQEMIKNEGLSLDRLRDICVIVEKRWEMTKK